MDNRETWKKEYWEQKGQDTEPKLKFSSCFKCNRSTYISNNILMGVTLYEYEGKYYCLQHHPYRKQVMRDRHSLEFAKAIDKMRKLSFIRTGKKKLASRDRRAR